MLCAGKLVKFSVWHCGCSGLQCFSSIEHNTPNSTTRHYTTTCTSNTRGSDDSNGPPRPIVKWTLCTPMPRDSLQAAGHHRQHRQYRTLSRARWETQKKMPATVGTSLSSLLEEPSRIISKRRVFFRFPTQDSEHKNNQTHQRAMRHCLDSVVQKSAVLNITLTYRRRGQVAAHV